MELYRPVYAGQKIDVGCGRKTLLLVRRILLRGDRVSVVSLAGRVGRRQRGVQGCRQQSAFSEAMGRRQ